MGVGFIQHQDSGALGDCPGQQDALALAAGELRDGTIFQVSNFRSLKCLFHNLEIAVGQFLESSQIGETAHSHDLGHRKGKCKVLVRGNHGNLSGQFSPPQRVQGAVLQTDLTTLGLEQARHELQQSRLATPIGSDQGQKGLLRKR